MALLGLFSKRDKSKSSRSTTPSKSNASEVDSAETDYVLPNAHGTPAAPNGLYSNPGASSSKLRLGFGHKKSPHTATSDSSWLQPPLVQSPTSAMSETDLDHLRPPLSKSALFSAYSDSPGAHSTRSLPTKPLHSRTNSREVTASVDGHSNTGHSSNTEKDRKGRNDKKGGFLAWARGRSKSRPPQPPPELAVDLSAESFNLKSFRHIGSDSPVAEVPRPPSSLSSPFNTPPVRPRGNSVASDASQRISVAAFREMAARQRANSPSPALRPPSRTELSRFENSSPISGRRTTANVTPSATRSSTALALHSDSTSEEESDSGDSESEESGASATLRPKRNRTITQRSASASKSKATSELGHRSRSSTATATPTRAARSNLGHEGESSSISPSASAPRDARPGSRPGSIYARNRASASMSALQPNAAARRASLRTAAKAPMPASRPSMLLPSSDSSDTDSDDSDNAPLSRLVAPKRPGSAASNATSGSRSRVPARPLIDIAAISPPTLPPLPTFETSGPPPAPEKSEKTPSSPISPSSVYSSDKPTLADRLARIAQSSGQKSKENLTGGGVLERRSLDYLNLTDGDKEAHEKPAKKAIPQPTRSQTAPMGSLEPLATSSSTPMKSSPRLKPNGRSLSSPNAAASPVDLTGSNPIHPIPIRERSPPPAFSVTSRPTSQVSSSSNQGTSTSPNSSPNSIPTIRAVGPTPSSPTRDRSKMPAPTSEPTPRNPMLRNPPPRTSSMNVNSVLIPDSGRPESKAFTGGGLLSTAAATPREKGPLRPRAGRQRSSTMFDSSSPAIASLGDNASAYTRSSRNLNTLIPSPNSHSSSQSKSLTNSSSNSSLPPPKPFVDNSTRGNSPGSSTASSTRLPLTPGEGSEIGSRFGRKMVSSDSSASGVSSSNASAPVPPSKKGHRKSSSLTFEESGKDRGRRGQKESAESEEARRRERRRSEAKAAVELGNIVNGRGPIIADDDDEDVPLSNMPPRMSMMNPMLSFTPPTPVTWQSTNNMMSPMPSPPNMMFPVPPTNADPAFLAAHQQAMMIAKQAYQMAVAQQAMAQANEEWERGSNATSAFGGGFSGMSNMSSMGNMGGMNGMNGMGGMGMGMFPGQFGMPGWTGSMMFPNSAQSMYAGSVIGSELGGGGGWGSQSVYGGPGDRSSRLFNGAAGGSQANFSSSRSDAFGPTSSRPGPRPRTKTAPSDGNLPTQHARARGAAPPPSSWKRSPQRGV